MKILLTGAGGYIGRRLKRKLLADPRIELRLFVLNREEIAEAVRERADIVEGSTFDRDALRRALEGVEVAYYLIHSMGAGSDFAELDRKSANNFIEAALSAGVRRIIYLGGLGVMETASPHLKSRHEPGRSFRPTGPASEPSGSGRGRSSVRGAPALKSFITWSRNSR